MVDFKIEGDTVVIEAPEKLKAQQLRDMAAWMNRHGIAARAWWRPETRYADDIMKPDPRAFLLSYECDKYGFDSIDEEGWDGVEGHRWQAADLRDCLMIAHFDVGLWGFRNRGKNRTNLFRAEIVHHHDGQCDILACCESWDDTMAFAGLILWAEEASRIRDRRKVVTPENISKHCLAKQLHEAFLSARAA